MNWRNLFLHNLGWKLFSLLIAMLVWNTYHLTGGSWLGRVLAGDTKNANYVGFRPRILTRQGETRQFRTRPEQVEITVSGAPADIDRLEVKDILAFVDAQEFKEGDTNSLPVTVRVGLGYNVTRIVPERVHLERVKEE
jgi:hypothetical protein